MRYRSYLIRSKITTSKSNVAGISECIRRGEREYHGSPQHRSQLNNWMSRKSGKGLGLGEKHTPRRTPIAVKVRVIGIARKKRLSTLSSWMSENLNNHVRMNKYCLPVRSLPQARLVKETVYGSLGPLATMPSISRRLYENY